MRIIHFPNAPPKKVTFKVFVHASKYCKYFGASCQRGAEKCPRFSSCNSTE